MKKVLEDMNECGYSGTTIVTTCDQERPFVDLQNEISRKRAGITVPSNSAVGDSRGNGRIENAIQRFQN